MLRKIFSIISFFHLSTHTQLIVAQNSFIDTRTKVKIIFVAEAKMFPDSWNTGEIKAKVEKLDKNEIERSKKIIQNALNKYPTKVITNNLTKIYILNRITFYENVDYGGTYHEKTVFIANSGVANGYTDEFVEQTFHHEFSSILFFNYPKFISQTAWKQPNAPDIKYGKGGLNALQTDASSTDFDEKLNKKGFLTQYSTAALEEDFNIFAQHIFKASPQFWEIVEKNIRLKKKLNILVKFYQSINPKFTLDYFKKISKE